MKKAHLICNAHIDPSWMWDYQEGIGVAVSTFYQAAEFCREFDYIFNHNESLLYEFIERTDPELFARIVQLVREGKWHIMGGWYLQPDCNLPSGESIVRQIRLGRRYFAEKFAARPTVAVNFDTFGHSVGIVQILKKCGFDGYICCRPMPEMVQLPAREFYWVGLDGSRLKAVRADDESLYLSIMGNALEDVKRKLTKCGDADEGLLLWGVGNHGGNPSRKDLADIGALIAEHRDCRLLHSTPEAYFENCRPAADYRRSLQPCLIGAYTSMNSIKQKNIRLETMLFNTEKLCAAAELAGLYKADPEIFVRAQKELCFLQFHDTMAGTVTEEAEASALRKADCALQLLQDAYDGAFFALCGRYTRAAEGAFPIFAVNTQPYRREAVVEAEILMPIPIENDEQQYTVTAWQDGKVIPSQCIKELSNINYDRRKRIAFRCTLEPMNLTRVELTVEKTQRHLKTEHKGDILFQDSVKTVRISADTGLLESYRIGNCELLAGGAFAPVLYDDNADPWGWYMDTLGSNPVPMHLSECTRAPFAGLQNVQLVEDGPVMSVVEAFFEGGSSFVKLQYKLYRDVPYIDVTAEVLWNEEQKALKLMLPTAADGAFVGQIPFGTDTFPTDGTEHPIHRFAGLQQGAHTLALYNDCTYGFSCQGRTLYATLLRGAAYVAHPIDGRPLLKENRHLHYIEQGRHTFRFRLSYDRSAELENRAAEFVSGVYAINYFPHGSGDTAKSAVTIENPAVSLAAFYKDGDGYELRLVSNNPYAVDTAVSAAGDAFTAHFGPYEVKTYRYTGTRWQELALWA